MPQSDVLINEIVRDEGLELKPYKDTEGKWTIGVGRNLTDRGIDHSVFKDGIDLETAIAWLQEDVDIAIMELDKNFPWWQVLPEPQQRALINMSFNLGIPRLKGFKKMLSALEQGDYDKAAEEALNSKWAKQVKGRANRIADQLRGI